MDSRLALQIGVGAGVVIGGGVVVTKAWGLIKRRAFAKTLDRETGEMRRQAVPPNVDCTQKYIEGSYEYEVARSQPLLNERSFLKLKDGTSLFYQTWAPKYEQVRGVLVLIHGFGDHCDFAQALMGKALANLTNFAIVAFDLPGHGRSDGIHVHIPNWLHFVEQIKEAWVDHLRPLAKEKWGAHLPIFALGESMGGGILATLLIQDKTLFDGAIFNVAMLSIDKDLLPSSFAIRMCKFFLVKLLPLWPIIPAQDSKGLLFSDPKMHDNWENAPHQCMLLMKAKPRVATTFELAFNGVLWLQERLDQIDTPALIIHGAADKITDPNGSKTLHEKMQHKDKQLLLLEGQKHGDTLHGGPTLYSENKATYQEIAAWLKARGSDFEWC